MFAFVIRLPDIFKSDILKTSWRRFAKNSSRRFQDVFRKYHWRQTGLVKLSSAHFYNIFKTFLWLVTLGKFVLITCLQQVFKTYCKNEYQQKDSLWRNFFKNLWRWYEFSKSQLVRIQKKTTQLVQIHLFFIMIIFS